MVVVLAALCAYRYHRHLQQQDEQEQQQAAAAAAAAAGLNPNTATRTSTASQSTSTASQSIEQTLTEQWQRTEPLRRTSSDILRSALSCSFPQEQEEEPQNQLREDHSTNNRRQRKRRHVHITRQRRTHSAPMEAEAAVFREDIRQAWIDAVFGTDFYRSPDYVPPRHGEGILKGIDPFVTYACNVPVAADSKVGLTLTKLSLGLYVRHVEPHSEAHSAGVREGSILISFNRDMNLLAEPSRQALERMWQYEGMFEDDTASEQPPNSNLASKEPVLLTLLDPKQQQQHPDSLYTACLFRSPFGISWAPCGHFGMVQRACSAAAAAGVRRGSLVAAINHDNIKNKSMRDLVDHVDWGMLLKELSHQENVETVHVVLCMTPGASRPGYYDRQQQALSATTSNSNKTTTAIKTTTTTSSSTRSRNKSDLPGTRTDDGVEVRVHPLDHSLRTLFQGNRAESFLDGGSSPNTPAATSISELAANVTAGTIVAPTRRQQQQPDTRRHAKDRVYGRPPPFPGILYWNALEALVHCLRLHRANYHQDVLEHSDCAESSLELLDRLGPDTCEPFLIQCVSMLCAERSEESGKVVGVHEYSVKMISMLLSIARGNEDFSLRLYFLLRSFSGALSSEHVELINSAYQQLTRQILNEPTLVAVSTPRKSSGEETSPVDTNTDGEPQMPNPSSSSSESPNQQDTTYPIESVTPKKKKKKKKSILRALGKKKKKSKAATVDDSAPSVVASSKSREEHGVHTPPRLALPEKQNPASPPQTDYYPMPTLLENTTNFFAELDGICDTIERTLLKSVSQKIADWALQPWSSSKETALAKVAQGMRESLAAIASQHMPLVNPIDSSEVLVSVDPNECYILPSAHFPLLLTLNVDKKAIDADTNAPPPPPNTILGEEKLYRTRIVVVGLRGAVSPANASRGGTRLSDRSYFVQAAVAGVVKESGRSSFRGEKPLAHSWTRGNVLTFDTRSSWGAPQTVSLSVSSMDVNGNSHDQLSHTDDKGTLYYSSEMGHCWVDLKPIWDRVNSESKSSSMVCHAQVCSLGTDSFNEDGSACPTPVPERFELELSITTELLEFDDPAGGLQPRKRMLLYKHDDDLRQEMFAIDFIRMGDSLLKACGLDLKLLTFRCIPVGERRGFIEWVPGSVPMSELCEPFRSTLVPGPGEEMQMNGDQNDVESEGEGSLSEVAKAGLGKYQSLHRVRSNRKPGDHKKSKNPIQDFLRSFAYDPNAPYLIRKQVMDTYIKSCAGYCVLTYILGIGDRHLDNLLLHQTGCFFHCDYSFILGRDPKKYLPVRITETMVQGMGGKESDGYALFTSLTGAAFCALRRHENVRVLFTLVRLMAPAALPDVSQHQTADEAISSMRDRLRLDLSDAEASAFMEDLIESAISSKMWMAVDAIHSLGKRF